MQENKKNIRIKSYVQKQNSFQKKRQLCTQRTILVKLALLPLHGEHELRVSGQRKSLSCNGFAGWRRFTLSLMQAQNF